MAAPKLTPMFEQYLGIKEEYPDALLFYRMGDFYELFFEDAETAARELSITLTSRNPNSETRIPMCGVPHHSVTGYLSKLMQKGFRVAICDQIEDPKEAKGLVKRAVTRVLTPGTVLEDENLEAAANNFLAAYFYDRDRGVGGLAWADASTGQWTGIHSRKEQELLQWLLKLAPREVLLPDSMDHPPVLDPQIHVQRVPYVTHFSPAKARERILKAQEVPDESLLGLVDKRELLQACGAILAYLKDTQKQEFPHLAPFTPMSVGKHLILDEVTERNLELFRTLDGKTGRGTLVHVLDRTVTPMGGRLLRERMRQPWRNRSDVQKDQECVAFYHDHDGDRDELRAQLAQIYDLERLSTRVNLDRCTPKDLAAMRASLARLPELRLSLSLSLERASQSGGQHRPPVLASLLTHWDDCADLSLELTRALVDNPPTTMTEGGLINKGYHPELDRLMELTDHGESALDSLLEKERAAGDIPKLKLGYNKVFGYFFELPRVAARNAPDHFIRRQTLTNSERFTTEELGELESSLASAHDRRTALEYRLFQELRAMAAEARPRILFMAQAVAALDYWQCLAMVARERNFCRPELDDSLEIHIQGGRHPVVEAVQGEAHFIPNDLAMDISRRVVIITGPNMAGKSTVLRQTAIISIMAQMGSFVPATSARLGIMDRIFSRVGASDNLAQGQSTFMVEMTETARILRQATPRSLVILDEIGRGTSTFDGLALAWSVVEEICSRGQGGVRTLFATHYHELTVLETELTGVANMNIAIKEYGGDIVFLRRLVPGPSDRSYGIEVARLAGVPRKVVARAKELLATLEEKARKGECVGLPQQRSQGLLPGMPQHDTSTDTERGQESASKDSELLRVLKETDIDALTPLEALNLLHHWKAKWGNS